MRASEREAQRRHRELIRRQQQAAKMAEMDRAAYEVEVFDSLIDVLTSVHREPVEEVDWESIVSAAAPVEPSRSDDRERMARRELDQYQPNVFGRALGRGAARRAALERAVEEARTHDDLAHERALSDHQRDLREWEESRRLAEGVKAGDRAAYAEALRKLDPVSDLLSLGARVSFTFDGAVPEARVHVSSKDVVPSEEKTLLKTGKLSVKAMPKGRFFEIYQDYVCGTAMRVANEMLAVLPVPAVLVTALDTMLNPATGHLEDQPVLSVAVPRDTMRRLNLEAVDPSEAMANFVHQMNFKKTQGFAPVKPVDPSALTL